MKEEELKTKVFSWIEMWDFIDLLIDNRHSDIENLFTERGENGKLIHGERAKDFIEKINHLNNEY